MLLSMEMLQISKTSKYKGLLDPEDEGNTIV
jgi:hypothetical protein